MQRILWRVHRQFDEIAFAISLLPNCWERVVRLLKAPFDCERRIGGVFEAVTNVSASDDPHIPKTHIKLLNYLLYE